MLKNDPRYAHIRQILREELVPAMGCTEPIAIAYAAAKARAILGCLPDEAEVRASGNIIKNVKSVVVPNTDGLKGIEAAAAAGIVAGREEKILEVISDVTSEEKAAIAAYMRSHSIRVVPDERDIIFAITVTLRAGDIRCACPSRIITRTSCSSSTTARCSSRTAKLRNPRRQAV